MINFLTKGLTKLFGTKSDKDIKAVLPYVELTNTEFAKLKDISDDELRARTENIREEINNGLSTIDEKIEGLNRKIKDDPNMDIHHKEEIFAEIDKLEEERNKDLEDILLQVLPKGFAIVKETARRFKENKTLRVTANMYDKQLAATYQNVELEGDTAIWHNKWVAAGNEIVWDMLHYDVQIIGGIVLHQGKISEMATGEGKTLVATLPAFLNALAGRGVHIVTVNEYLAKRDSEWMAPIFQFHGMKVDCIDKHQPNSEERRSAYGADITYGTNNEYGFDYLRDNMARDSNDLVQRRHHFAMVDEVDSVLIDDARTPLIISGPVPRGDEHEFYELKPRIGKLVDVQRKLASQYLQEAKKLISEGNEKDGGLALFRAYRAFPKYKPLIKYLSEGGIRQVLQKTENYYLADNGKLMPEADEPLYFTIEEKNNSVELTEKGIDLITGEGEDPNFFILPDIGTEIAKLEDKTDWENEQAKIQEKDSILQDYSTKAKRIHTVNQLLKAYSLFEKDTEYILVDGKVKIVDEQTGRVMEGRRYSDGLHQAIEAKENVKVEDATQTYATITLQNYFRMYHKLSGMTGTAETEAGEFWEIYKLDVVVIPTNRPIVRDDRQDKVYRSVREKFNAVVEEVVELTEQGRPVLVGTTSVEISELLSRMLNLRKIKHQVLNAKQHAREADVVAEAGKPGTVTIATNMAGRGTDIKLTAESKQAGGLAIIGTERHESRRVDRQLRGRAGRQGDPGSSQFFVSLEDNLMRLFGSDRIAKIMDRLGLEEGEVIQHSMITKSIERAQKKVEENNFGTRKRLLEYDDVMNSQREVIYKRRRHALHGNRLQLDIMNMMYDTVEEVITNTRGAEDYDGFKLNMVGTFGMDINMDHDSFTKGHPAQLVEQVYSEVYKHYREKNKRIADTAYPIFQNIEKERGATVEDIVVPLTDGKRQIQVVSSLKKNLESDCSELIESMEKIITLALIDQTWKEHLRDMDDLKQSVQSAVWEQKDPLLIYKFEGFELFKAFIAKLNEDVVSFLAKSNIPVRSSDEVQEARARQRQRQKLQEQKAESGSVLSGGGQASSSDTPNRPPREKTAPVKSEKIVGRNERVSVQYTDGRVVKDVKFKNVEEDLRNNRCVIIES
ncbi:preprotein translocase subunit SecA [Roseivirga sp. BDSF3-8]|uniref:preprotein translocase subunit SecA n=1 Tax=Roseivirga sp. BDSF3-8 TaxID=3241598 RepID=UPI00353229DF